MKTFSLIRIEDETGISGTGKVAQGVVFDSGKVAISWLTQWSSICIYDDIEHVEEIHGHNGKTIIYYDRLPIPEPGAEKPVVFPFPVPVAVTANTVPGSDVTIRYSASLGDVEVLVE